MSSSTKGKLPPFPDVVGHQDKSTFEPHVPSFIKGSRFFVRTVGMREAPERLIVELFRELCFESVTPNSERASRDLEPHDELTLEENALLHVARGREKQAHRKLHEKSYYGPLYPFIARNSWPRKQAESVIAFQLLDGPFLEHFSRSKEKAETFSREVINAIYGNKRTEYGDPDIFSTLAERIHFDEEAVGLLSKDAAIEKLKNRLTSNDTKGKIGRDDKLAARISEDFSHLCRIEGKVPRLLWLDLLKCFLRLSLPAWLLAQMRITVSLRDWTMAALAGEIARPDEISNAIESRWCGLFHPTQTGSNEISLHVERYIKARIEFSLATYAVRHISNFDPNHGKLTLQPGNKEDISIADWLGHCHNSGIQANLPRDRDAIRDLFVPWAQTFGAWLTPDKKGQGKNIIEFLRIFLRLSESINDDGYLVTGTGRFERGKVFPGPAMLRTVLYLAAARRAAAGNRNHGKLILSDLETHFSDYGVDFASSVGARPKLIEELARLGMLKGSPDAGDSAELVAPETLSI